MKWFIVGVAMLLTAGLAGCAQHVPSTAGTALVAFDAAQCPPTLGRAHDVSPADAPTDHLILEQPRPEAGIVCRYTRRFGPHETSGPTLVKEVRLDRRGAARLAAAVARVRVGVPSGTLGCPADTGSVTLIGFTYEHRRPARLWWHASGCQHIDNGATEAAEVANDSFFHFQRVFAATRRAI